MAQFIIRPGREGQFGGVDPALMDILQKAALAAPPSISKVEVFSGKTGRSTGTKNHPRGWGVDLQLYDEAGTPLANYAGNPFGVKSDAAKKSYPIYEQFAQTARTIQETEYPQLTNRFRWGGYFVGGVNPGDLMHFDISGGMMKGTPPQAERWADGIGGLTKGRAALAGLPALPASLTAASPGPPTVPSDPEVARLQDHLRAKGLYDGPSTGVMDAATTAAAQAYGKAAGGDAPGTTSREIDLMARVMLAEARGEGPEGMAAVGWVAKNRAATGGLWPTNVADVLTQKDQFAAPYKGATKEEYQAAATVAAGVLNGSVPDPTGGATFFATPDAPRKKWMTTEPFRTKIGNHNFYGGTPPTETAAAVPTPRPRPLPAGVEMPADVAPVIPAAFAPVSLDTTPPAAPPVPARPSPAAFAPVALATADRPAAAVPADATPIRPAPPTAARPSPWAPVSVEEIATPPNPSAIASPAVPGPPTVQPMPAAPAAMTPDTAVTPVPDAPAAPVETAPAAPSAPATLARPVSPVAFAPIPDEQAKPVTAAIGAQPVPPAPAAPTPPAASAAGPDQAILASARPGAPYPFAPPPGFSDLKADIAFAEPFDVDAAIEKFAPVATTDPMPISPLAATQPPTVVSRPASAATPERRGLFGMKGGNAQMPPALKAAGFLLNPVGTLVGSLLRGSGYGGFSSFAGVPMSSLPSNMTSGGTYNPWGGSATTGRDPKGFSYAYDDRSGSGYYTDSRGNVHSYTSGVA